MTINTFSSTDLSYSADHTLSVIIIANIWQIKKLLRQKQYLLTGKLLLKKSSIELLYHEDLSYSRDVKVKK